MQQLNTTKKHKKTNHMMSKLEWLSKKLRLNALTKNFILFESVTKIIYMIFYTVCKTLNLCYTILFF